jgi:hypothetical protein
VHAKPGGAGGGDQLAGLSEQRRVSQLVGGCVSHDEALLAETYPLCEACAHKVALALKAAHELVCMYSCMYICVYVYM